MESYIDGVQYRYRIIAAFVEEGGLELVCYQRVHLVMIRYSNDNELGILSAEKDRGGQQEDTASHFWRFRCVSYLLSIVMLTTICYSGSRVMTFIFRQTSNTRMLLPSMHVLQ